MSPASPRRDPIENLEVREIRAGAWERQGPTIVDSVLSWAVFALRFQTAQLYSKQPSKVTGFPGLRTIGDTVVDEYDGKYTATRRVTSVGIHEHRGSPDPSRTISYSETVDAQAVERAARRGPT